MSTPDDWNQLADQIGNNIDQLAQLTNGNPDWYPTLDLLGQALTRVQNQTINLRNQEPIGE